MFLTTRPNASLSHAINTTPQRRGRKASTGADRPSLRARWGKLPGSLPVNPVKLLKTFPRLSEENILCQTLSLNVFAKPLQTLRMTFSDYRRWCSPQLFQSELDHQLEQWWKKGETFSTSLREFQSSTCQLLTESSWFYVLDPMELYVWHNSPMLLSFPHFNLEMVPAELSNFFWYGVQFLGHTWTKCTIGFGMVRCGNFHPRNSTFRMVSSIYLWTFHRCRHQWLLDFGFRPRSEQSGTLTALFTLDQCPFALKAQHFWAELLCKGLYFLIMQGLTFWKFWSALIDRDHGHFCMLMMHMHSTRATLELVQSSSTDFYTPAALLLKAPRARLWTFHFKLVSWLTLNQALRLAPDENQLLGPQL